MLRHPVFKGGVFMSKTLVVIFVIVGLLYLATFILGIDNDPNTKWFCIKV